MKRRRSSLGELHVELHVLRLVKSCARYWRHWRSELGQKGSQANKLQVQVSQAAGATIVWYRGDPHVPALTPEGRGSLEVGMDEP